MTQDYDSGYRPGGTWRPAAPSGSRVAGPVRSVAFWAAVFLPLAYPPVLVDGGAPNLLVLGGLLGLHAATLSVGHGHRQP